MYVARGWHAPLPIFTPKPQLRRDMTLGHFRFSKVEVLRQGDGVKYLRYMLAFGCMAAWLWLTLHGYVDVEFWKYNNEFGRLVLVLPCAAAALIVLAWQCARVQNGKLLARLWTPASFCMMLPVMLGTEMSPVDARLLGYGVSVLAGCGFAVCFVLLGGIAAALPLQGMGMVAGGGMLAAHVIIALMSLLPQSALALLPFMLTAVIKLLVPAPGGMQAVGRGMPSLHGMALCALAFGVTGFSKSVYYGIFTVISPWFPEHLFYNLLIPGASCLLSLLCIQLSIHSAKGRSLLLVIPILVVGYTAWPLLHRESPGLSLLTLSFAYTVLDVFCYLALFSLVSRFEGAVRLRLLGGMGGGLLLGLWMGSATLPFLRENLSQGVGVNYMFAFLAVTLLVNSLAFALMLEYTGFWRGVRGTQGFSAEGGHAPPQLLAQEPNVLLPSEGITTHVCDSVLRQLDLTRQQALIATLIVQKRSDAEICASLNISQSTLKTHVRNILKRLGLNSRYEIAWLIVHKMQEGRLSQGNMEC